MAYSFLISYFLLLSHEWTILPQIASLGFVIPSTELLLRSAVIGSLACQLVLVFGGNTRKHKNPAWNKALLWLFYLSADNVAITALSVLARNASALVAENSMQTFWAPFPLLHLGGPDTIAAYSLEDNEIWKRHLFQLCIQTLYAVYVMYKAWNGSLLSILTIPIMIAGLIKYGERIWVMWSSSSGQRRLSMPKFDRTWTPVKQVLASAVDNPIPEGSILEVAHGLFQLSKLFLLDVPIDTEFLSEFDVDPITTGEILFYEGGWKVIEVELGFAYDMLYTKAMVSQSICGICLRFTSFLLTTVVLLVLSSTRMSHYYSQADVYTTFILLGVAVFLELYAALKLLTSDGVILWLTQNRMATIAQAINSLQLFRTPRWLNSIGQFNLLLYSLDNERISLLRIKFPELYVWKRSHRYVTQLKVSEELKRWLVMHFENEAYQAMVGLREEMDIGTSRGKITLRGNVHGAEMRTPDLKFRQSILTWHIATEICYHLDQDHFSKQNQSDSDTVERVDRNVHLNYEMSKYISRYMMYLVVISPDKLPSVEAHSPNRLQATCKELWEYFGRFARAMPRAPLTLKEIWDYFIGSKFDMAGFPVTQKEQRNEITVDAHRKLSECSPDTAGASLLGTAVKLANGLRACRGDGYETREGVAQRWKVIAGVWIELLAYAAIQCKGSQHAQQLAEGAELLTHVWLLLAHVGLTHHINFVIPTGFV